MNPETLENIIRETYQPIQKGGGLDQPPMAGKRNLENSPELFPHLSLDGCKLLEEVAKIAISLEERFSWQLTPNDQNILYTPPAIKEIVDIAEMLVRRPKINSLDSSEKSSHAEYSLSEVLVTKVSVYGKDGNHHQSIERMEMSFSGSGDVRVSIQPTTIRETFAKGKRIRRFYGASAELVKETLSFRGRSPEDVLSIAESHQEIHPALAITNNRAELKIAFRNGDANCELSIQGKNYNYDSQPDNGQQADSEEGDNCASIKEEYVKAVQMVVPLTNFRRFKNGKPPSQEAIDQWLHTLVSEMAGTVRKY